jgi:hypothetical protein
LLHAKLTLNVFAAACRSHSWLIFLLQIKLTLKTASGKPVNAMVLEKLGTSNDDLDGGKRKRKLELLDNSESQKMRKMENQVEFVVS